MPDNELDPPPQDQNPPPPPRVLKIRVKSEKEDIRVDVPLPNGSSVELD